jgi:hypothetical protein
VNRRSKADQFWFFSYYVLQPLLDDNDDSQTGSLKNGLGTPGPRHIYIVIFLFVPLALGPTTILRHLEAFFTILIHPISRMSSSCKGDG